jgi:aldose 1-epimerase
MKTGLISFIVLTVAFSQWSCSQTKAKLSITEEPFGSAPDGKSIQLYTLTNAAGMKVQITNYGGIIKSLTVPDRNGVFADVVLGYDRLDQYVKSNPFFGALIGRYGNRIAAGKFSLNGETYTLAVNNGVNHLHGGIKGFDKVVWDAKTEQTEQAVSLKLSYLSKDGEEGYPGNLHVQVTYSLTNDNELQISYQATTDKPTVCNLTNHSYFNLKDGGASPILDHVLQIDADRYTPVDATLIPTGDLVPVEGTPFDFRQPTAIGARINDDNEQLKNGGGYDHNFVLNSKMGELRLAVTVTEPTMGRVMQVYTTEPGVQFYSGNFLDGSITGKKGIVYQKRSGLCLETQHFPDSPNQPDFPTTTLNPGETYQSKTVYKFSTER